MGWFGIVRDGFDAGGHLPLSLAPNADIPNIVQQSANLTEVEWGTINVIITSARMSL